MKRTEKMTKAKLKKLISQMTIEEKIGQLVQLNAAFFIDSKAGITGPMEKLGIRKEFLPLVGSILNFQSPDEMCRIQEQHLAEDRNHIPMICMMDVIHGYRTVYPIPLALGCSFDPALVEECSAMASREAASGGIHVTFTPMVDYVRDARWGRVLETCGEDALLNGVMGAAQVRGFQGDDLSDPEHIATCVKHFAAYGGAEAGKDYNTVEISEHALRSYYLPAYRACLDAGAKMVMPSFNDLNGVPSVANKMLHNILRREWKFDGMVISDYNAVGELLKHGVAEDLRTATKLAFENECDMEMMSAGYCNHLKELIDSGVFTEKQLDRSVERVLSLKAELGLFEDPYRGASNEKRDRVCLTPEHREIARRAAEESAVLLKNDGILPFSAQCKKIALIGPFADNHAIKGAWACCGKDAECVTVKEGIAALLPDATIEVAPGCANTWDSTDVSGFADAVNAAKNADAVVLCLGEPQDYSGEGNCRADLGLPGMQLQLAREVLAVNPNAAVLLFNGRPLVLTGLEEIAPAILDMWFPGTEGGSAAADLLFGKAVPCGKVSMSFPKAVGQCPIYYNRYSTGRPKTKPENVHQKYASNYVDCGNLPLYSFGHGLSYTTFEYLSLETDREVIGKEDVLTVSITVKNTGDRTGKETVQLYMRDVCASAVRPVQELIAFEKISLQPGESKTVMFRVTEPMLRFWNADCNYISEPGRFTLSTGYADHLILSKDFTLQ